MNPLIDNFGFREIEHDDRRMFKRKAAQGTVTGQVMRSRQPVAMELRDLSLGGVSGWTSHAVNKGDVVDLAFPPDGARTGFSQRGKVVRCEPSALGFRVAVQFERVLGM